MKRVAIFGGAGFIGTNLVYRLANEGCQVYNFDNLSGMGNLLNLGEVMLNPHHNFARCDVFNENDVSQALRTAAVDTVFVTVSANLRNMQETVDGIDTLLSTIVKWRDTIHASGHPLHRIIFLTGRTGCDDVGDPRLEVLRHYCNKSLPLINLSTSNVFGPYQQPNNYIPYLIYRAIEGESIPVVSGDSVTLGLVPVDDVVDALRLLEEKGDIHQCYKLSPSRDQLTNFQIADCICDVLNTEVPPPIGRYQSLIDFPDITLNAEEIQYDGDEALMALGYGQKRDIRESLIKTVRWYLHHTEWYMQSRLRFFNLWQDPSNVEKLGSKVVPF